MRLYSNDKTVLMEVSSLERDGNDLLVRGKVLGAMPMTARLTPQECRAGLKLVNLRLVWFLLTLPFRKTKRS
jgi:hypothetical protein